MFGLLKLLIILAIVSFLLRGFFRLIYPKVPSENSNPKVLEMKACEYCGILNLEDTCTVRKGHIFCSVDHASKFFN